MINNLKDFYNIQLEEEAILESEELADIEISNLKESNKTFALHFFFEYKNLQKAKQHFYACGLLDAYLIKNYQHRMFGYDIPSVCYDLLSDNLPFLQNEYAYLFYNTTYLDEDTEEPVPITTESMVLEGGRPLFFVTLFSNF